MFGLFKSKTSGVKVLDKIWMSKAAKLNAAVSMLKANPDCLFVAWFESTAKEFELHLNLNRPSPNLVMASELSYEKALNRMVVFVEHYPLAAVEQSLFLKSGLQEAPVLSALDEPFFQKFGGPNLVDLMRKLDMKEDDIVSHSLVSKSIRRAQDKIAGKVKIDQKAASPEEWFSINLGKV